MKLLPGEIGAGTGARPLPVCETPSVCGQQGAKSTGPGSPADSTTDSRSRRGTL